MVERRRIGVDDRYGSHRVADSDASREFVGGYPAGRLRTKWANIHTDEVYFRDTAHGFLAWAVALVGTAAFLTSAAAYMVGGAASSAAGGIATGILRV